MPKNKEMKLTILGVVFLLILIIGASYSYFSIVNSENGSTSTTLNGVTESLDRFGTSVLRQQTEDLHINLGLSDLAPGKIGTSYYATENESEKYNKEQTNHNLTLVEIYDGSITDLAYTCTSEITIKTDGISSEEINVGDGKVYLGYTSETIGNEARINPKEIDLKEVVLASEGYKVPVEYTIIGNSNLYVTGDFKITNQASDQNALAGKSISIEISNKNLSCSVDKVNIMPPKDFNFYVQNNSDENKYTNTEEVDVYLSWTDDDVDSYCVTEGTIDDCVWQKTEGNSVTDKYTIQDNTTGEKKLKAYLKDSGGNVSDVVEDTIIIDKEEPTLETLKIKESYTNKNEVSVELVGKDNYEVSEYCLTETEGIEGCTWKEITDEIKGNVTSVDGNKKLYGYVKDKAGNVSEVKESNEVVLDTNAPVVETFTLDSEYATSEKVSGTITYSDNLSGVEAYCIKSDNSSNNCNWINVSNATTTKVEGTINSEGKLYAFVKDKAGNVSLVKESNTVVLDSELPEITELTLKGTSITESDKYTSDKNIKVTIKGNDEVSGLSKYCLKTSEGTEGCDWKDISDGEIDFALSGEDGLKTVYAYVKDNAGNVSKVMSKNITLDTGAPSVTGLTLKGSAATNDLASTFTNTKDIKLTITSNDGNGTGVYEYCIVLGNTPESCSWKSIPSGEISYSLSETDGIKNVYAFVRDKVGNVSVYKEGTTMKSITLDTGAPSLTTFTLAGTALTDTDKVTRVAEIGVTLAYGDGTGSGVYQYCIGTNKDSCNGSWTTAATSVKYTLEGNDGDKTLYAFVKDKAGNVSTAQTKTMKLDTGKPSVTNLTLAGTAADDNQKTTFTRATGIKATLAYSDSGSGVYQYCLMGSNTTDGCSWQTATTNAVDYNLGTTDGVKNVYAFVRDKAGNVSTYTSGTTNKSITLDTGKPSLTTFTLAGTAADDNQKATVTRATGIKATLAYSDSGSGVYQYCIGTSNESCNGTWTTAATSVDYSLASGDGDKVLYAFVRDKAGNVSTSQTKTMKLDTGKPSVTGLTLAGTGADSNQNGSFTRATGIKATLAYNDGTGSGVYQYCLMGSNTTDGCSWKTATTAAVDYSLATGDGAKGVYAFVRDKAGNISAYTSGTTNKSITLDTGKPSLTTFTLAGTALTEADKVTRAAEIGVTLAYGDGTGSGVYQYCIGTSSESCNGTWTTAATSVKYNLAGTDGDKVLYAFVRDKAGNVSTSQTKTMKLDTGAPSVTKLTLAGTAADTTQAASFTSVSKIKTTIAYSDSGSGVYQYCLMGSNTTEGCSWQTATTNAVDYNLGTGDGVKNVYAFVRDKAGNVSAYTAGTTNKSITLDTGVPSISSVALKGTALNDTLAASFTKSTSVAVTLTYGDGTGSGVYQYCALVTTESTAPTAASGCTDKWTAAATTYTATLASANGTKYFHIYVKDKAGNISTVKSSNIMLDTGNPNVSSVTLTGTNSITSLKNTFTSDKAITVGLGYNDSGSGVYQYCLMSSNTTTNCSWQTAATSVSYTLATGDGSKDVYAFVRDKVGNVSAYTAGTTNKSITLDTTSPVLADANYTVTSSGPTNVTATIGTVTETNPYQYCFRNGASGNFECGTSKTKQYTATAGTTYTIYAYVMDKVGNVSTTLNKSVTPVKPTIDVLKEKDTKSNLTSSLVGGMYRYQGTNDVPNWICFGTRDQELCKREYDKYMYRIIGVTEEGQMYLLKETFLKEDSVTGFAWNHEYLINGSATYLCPDGVCPEWNEADLFKRINGKSNGTSAGAGGSSGKADTDIFVDNEYYDYLKSGDKVNGGTNESDWYNLIANHDWMYGDTTISSYSGNTLYAIETGDKENGQTNHYAKNEEGTVTKQPYTWTNTVNAKISLMYLHDYAYAYPNGTPESYTNVANSWIHFRKDGYNNSQSSEWLSTRWGIASTVNTYVSARNVAYRGHLNGGNYLNSGSGVRPVFYLSSEAKITEGDGTQSLPYILG